MVTSTEAEAQSEMAQRQFGPGDTPEFHTTAEESQMLALKRVREEFKDLKPIPYQHYINSHASTSYIVSELPKDARKAAEKGFSVVRHGLPVDLLNDKKQKKCLNEFLRDLWEIYGISHHQVAICACQRLVGDTTQEIYWVDINFM